MKKILALLPLMALSTGSQADTAYGSLGNFDAVNDTGSDCYGFEIEIDDVRSASIGGTYSYNHYGMPKIREDLTDPAHPKVFIRYEVDKPSGLITGTNAGVTKAANPGAIGPTGGHLCTNPGINQGCEHFGVGLYNTAYSAIKYNWLVKAPDNITNIPGPIVHVGTPNWYYQAPGVQPAVVKPAVVIPNPIANQPPLQILPPAQVFPAQVNINAPAQVVAVMPAPPAPVPANKLFGEPSWVKVIKTSTHKVNPLALEDLVGNEDANGVALWRNGIEQVPADIETEFYLMQTQTPDLKSGKLKNAAKAEKFGNPDDMGGKGDEVVTRRYEFYAYAGTAETLDGENGEAMCDNVATDGIHGIPGNVTVTQYDPANPGETMNTTIDCSQNVIVGEYLGSQMGEFNAVAPLDLINGIQNISLYEPFAERRLPNGGNTPYVTTVDSGVLPSGFALNGTTGILSRNVANVPKVGKFNFSVKVKDADQKIVVKNYDVNVTGPGDVDTDYQINTTDLELIRARNGQVAAAKDPADVNGDLKINILDYRKAASLCSKPKCGL